LFFEQLKGSGDNFSYVLADEESKEAIVVDPSTNVEEIVETVESGGLKVIYIVNTHAHRDHTMGNGELKQKYAAKIVAYHNSPVTKDLGVEEGDILRFGKSEASIMHTPGHSSDSICILIEDKVLTGDTLFVGECGRTDLSGGNSTDMYESLFAKLMHLDDNVEVYPGHDYGILPSSTIGREKMTNYVLKPRSLQEFEEFMRTP
jgi:glyoxylase-like metal-dependent hydrolase (beta-lactamase superfamily II)